MNKDTIIGVVLSVMFIGVSINYLKNYIDFKSAISENKPIPYTIIDKKINKGGRGVSYDMIIEYKNSRQTISITSKDYDWIQSGKYPELYYSKRSGLIFSKWEVKKAFRVALLFFILFVVVVARQAWGWATKNKVN